MGSGSQVPKVCFLGGARKKFARRSLPSSAKLVLGGTVTPKGRAMRSRSPSAAGRRIRPEAVTEQKTGYVTGDTRQSKVLICTLAPEVRRNHSLIRTGTSAARSAWIGTVVARWKALGSLLPSCAKVGRKNQPD